MIQAGLDGQAGSEFAPRMPPQSIRNDPATALIGASYTICVLIRLSSAIF
jgi:hypothetical protein